MNRTYIKDVVPGTVKIAGFCENIRNKKSMAFLVIRDVTGKIQVTVEKAKLPEIAELCDKLTLDSVVTVEGEAIASEYVKLGGIEILPTKLTIESIADALPIQEGAAIDSRLDYRWIDLRSRKNLLMLKAQTVMVGAMRNFLLSKNFTEIHTPKIIGAASESGSEVFKLNYFDRDTYLAQNPQFYKQMTMASGLERIFECGPVFRAEKSYTSKHTTEFTGFDLEMSYIDSFEDVMAFEEDLLTDMLEKVKEAYGDEIEALFGIPVVVPTKPFPRMSLKEIYRELEARYGYTCPESALRIPERNGRRGCKGPCRCRRKRSEGRYRTGINLYHTCHRRCWYASAFCCNDGIRGSQGYRRSCHCGRWYPLFRRCGEGSCCRCKHHHGRLSLCRS